LGQAGVTFPSIGDAGVNRALGIESLTGSLVLALVEEPFDPARPRAIGRQLVGLGSADPAALLATMRLIRTRAPELFDVTDPDRIGELLDELAAGYTDEVRRETRAEQETLLTEVAEARKATEMTLRAGLERFHTVFHEANAGIAIATLEGEVIKTNPALRAMFGGADALARPHAFTTHIHPEDEANARAAFEDMVSGRCRPMRGELRFVRPDGSVLWTYLTASVVRDGPGLPDYVVSVIEDITERRQLRSQLHHQAYHDPVTRLPNRSLMDEQLDWAFSTASSVERVGLCHLDLDGFRALNDSLGHASGDQLLLAVSTRLQALAEGYLVTRAGADEFAILVPDPPHAGSMTRLAEHILAGLMQPFAIGPRRVSVTASVGLAETAVDTASPAELRRRADAARSWAKNAGGARWTVFDARRDARELMRVGLAASIAAAVDRHEFQLMYQPLVGLDTAAMIGVEALVRWAHPAYGMLPPLEFIDLAERNGAIVPLGRWVLFEACRQARLWVDALGDAAPYVSVNVSPRQLVHPDWVDEVSAALSETELKPSQLQLEITERAVLSDEPHTSETLRTLCDMGVRLAIDDFGTGYSSLAYLRRLPVHGLKIDGSFIRGLREADPEDSKDDKIIQALITMAHALDLVVTAEWVETASQSHRLSVLGCDVGQGNWFGRPMSATALAPLLRRPLAG
jgi:diguanylate cyclase (GGDEF)-like protein/PAS domain S-box-containing protein